MSDDLLAKEKEFHRLNRNLQLKTCDIMKKVDSIVHACATNDLLDNINQTSSNIVIKNAKRIRPKDISNINKQLKTLNKVSEIPLKECIDNTEISPKNDNIGSKAIIILLKSKIDMLYKKLQEVQLEYNNKCDCCKELEVEKKKLEDIQIKLRNQTETLNDTITKLENLNSDVLSDCQVLKNENTTLKKDLESLKKEIKMLNQQSTNLDMRLNRSLENNEKLKNTLKCSQTEEKELRNQIRKLQEDKKLIIKNLEKQRSELMLMFKKQTLLINNLKKQNMLLMANGQIYLTKEDFAKLLEWKPQNTSNMS